jgi:hypothetical protein
MDADDELLLDDEQLQGEPAPPEGEQQHANVAAAVPPPQPAANPAITELQQQLDELRAQQRASTVAVPQQEVAELRAELRTAQADRGESAMRRDAAGRRGQDWDTPLELLQMDMSFIRYKPPQHPGQDQMPPPLSACRLHEKGMAEILKTTQGPITVWDESCTAEGAMFWFERMVQYATLVRIDICQHICLHLSPKLQQWFATLLKTQSYHHWVSDSCANLSAVLRRRFAHQVREDAALALQTLVEGRCYMGNESALKYVDRFMALHNRLDPGVMSEAALCACFKRGIAEIIMPKCLHPPATSGLTEWTDLTALMKHTERVYREHCEQAAAGRGRKREYNVVAAPASTSAHKHHKIGELPPSHVHGRSGTREPQGSGGQRSGAYNGRSRGDRQGDKQERYSPYGRERDRGQGRDGGRGQAQRGQPGDMASKAEAVHWGLTADRKGFLPGQETVSGIPGRIKTRLSAEGICFYCRGGADGGKHMSWECPWNQAQRQGR